MSNFADEKVTLKQYYEFIDHFFQAVSSDDLYGQNSSDDFQDMLQYKYGKSDEKYYTIAIGASKIVLIPNANSEYVIKIPFLGESEDEEFFLANDTVLAHEKLFEGVRPLPLEVSHWNYCEIESLSYELIKKYGATSFFAETFFLGMVQGHPVYLQKRVLNRTVNPSAVSSKRWEERPSNHYYKRSPSFAAFLDFYTDEEVSKLERLLEDFPITDLNSWNFGATPDGKPIIFDYSGYNDR